MRSGTEHTTPEEPVAPDPADRSLRRVQYPDGALGRLLDFLDLCIATTCAEPHKSHVPLTRVVDPYQFPPFWTGATAPAEAIS